jgi:hypothetical protein
MKRVLLVVMVAACTKAGGEKQGQGAVIAVAKDDVPYSAPKTATAPKPAGDLAWKVVDGPDALAEIVAGAPQTGRHYRASAVLFALGFELAA